MRLLVVLAYASIGTLLAVALLYIIQPSIFFVGMSTEHINRWLALYIAALILSFLTVSIGDK